MPDVHLADIPRHVSWRPGNFQTVFKAGSVDGIDVLHPDRHPNPFVGLFVAFRSKRHLDFALAATALTALTKENLALTGTNSAKCGWIAPVPCLLPSQLLEPC